MSFRSLKYTVVIGLLSIILLIALLPSIISSEWGSRQLLNLINRNISGKLQIQDIDIRWGHGQKMEGLLLKDPDGRSVIGIDKLLIDATLWQLLNKHYTDIVSSQIEGLNAAIIINQDGENNLQQALGIKAVKQKAYMPPSTIILSEVNAQMGATEGQSKLFKIHLQGKTRQEDLAGSFELDAQMPAPLTLDVSSLSEDYLSAATIHGNFVNFPLELVDSYLALRDPSLSGVVRAFLGERLNLIIDSVPLAESVLLDSKSKDSNSKLQGLTVNFQASSPQLDGVGKAIISQNTLFIKEPAIFHLKLDANPLNTFLPSPVVLHNSAPLTMTLSNFAAPLTFFMENGESDPQQFLMDVQLQLPIAKLDFYATDNLIIEPFNFALRTAASDAAINWQANAQLKQKNYSEPIEVKLQGSIDKAKNIFEFFKAQLPSLQSSLQLSHLPLTLFIPQSNNGVILESISAPLNILAQIKPIRDAWQLTVAAHSLQLSLPPTILRFEKGVLSAEKPFIISWEGHKNVLQQITQDEKLELSSPLAIALEIKKLFLQVSPALAYSLESEATIKVLEFPSLLSFGKLQLKNLNLYLDGPNATTAVSKIKAQVTLLTNMGAPHPLLNVPLELAQTSHWKYDLANQVVEMPDGALSLFNSSGDSLEMAIEYRQDGLITLIRPARLSYNLTPHTLKLLSIFFDRPLPKIHSNSRCNLTVEELSSFQWNNTTIESLHAKGNLNIDRVELISDSSTGKLLPILENISLPWVFDAPANTFSINIVGYGHSNITIKPSKISARFMVKDWLEEGKYDFSKAIIDVHANLFRLPTSVISTLIAQPDLSAIFGPYMDGELISLIHLGSQKPSFCDLGIDSANLHIRTRMQYANNTIGLFNPPKPVEVRFTMTQEGYKQCKELLQINDERVLANALTMNGRINELYLPLNDLANGKIDAQLTIEELNWAGRAKFNGVLNATIKNPTNLVDGLNVDLKFSSSHHDALESPIEIIAKMDILPSFSDKKIDLSKMGLKASLQGKLNSAFVQNLLPLSSITAKTVEQILGQPIEIKAACQLKEWNGTVNAQLNSTEAQCQLDGALNSGILTLKSPFKVEINMTPLLSQWLFANSFPLLNSAIAAQQPLQLQIDSQDFALPVVPWNIGNVQIPQGTLNLGKVQFANRGELRTFLELLHYDKEQVIIWFTPLYFKLIKGNLELQRMDMLLANTYHMACWGNIDIKTKRSNITLALDTQDLPNILGIKPAEGGEGQFLQIPLQMNAQGKMEVQISKLAQHMATFMAANQLKSKSKILDYFIEAGSSLAGTTSGGTGTGILSPPAPTTNPLPWPQSSAAKVENNTNKTETTKTESTLETLKQPLEALLKKEHSKKKKKSAAHAERSPLL